MKHAVMAKFKCMRLTSTFSHGFFQGPDSVIIEKDLLYRIRAASLQ